MVERIILKKVKNSKELVLDMVSTPEYVLKQVDWGTIKGTHHSYKYVNQVGVTISGTSLETRPVSIEGWIVALNPARMDILKKQLNSFINPQDAIDLYYDEYVIRFIPDETVKYAIDSSENNDAFCKFMITGTCPNPLFTYANESVSIFATTIPSFHFPLTISENSPEKGVIFGKRTDDLIVNAFNDGSVTSGMRIVFKANGTVVNPKLINVNTQERFILNKTLVAEEEVEVNTNIGEKSIKGKIGSSSYSNYYMYKDIDSSWLQLEVGDNLFRYDADDGLENLEIFVYFHNRFLEVQKCY
jgi:hypothetical protein